MLSLGWKKFSFFEQSLKNEDEFPEAASCCCPGADVIVAGCADGSVALLDRELQMKQAFQAHTNSTEFVVFLSVSSRSRFYTELTPLPVDPTAKPVT